MIQPRIEGAAELRRVAAQMRAQGRKDLSRQMDRALFRATKPIQAEIRAEAERSLPSGYAATLTASLAWRQSRRTGGNRARLVLRTFADGRARRRDIRALEKGLLRHPLYGEYEQPWYNTRFQGGFHDRGTRRAMERASAELGKVVREFAQKLIE
jgi:hypothetical protein